MYSNVIYSINRDIDQNKFFILLLNYEVAAGVILLGGVGLDEQYFGYGNVNTKCSKRTVFDYVWDRFKDNYSKLIPLFTKYFVYGVKALDFQGWCKVAELIKTSIHLAPQGLV